MRQQRVRPTHYVALQLSDPSVVESLIRMQRRLTRAVPALRLGLIPAAEFHMTLALLCLDSTEAGAAADAVAAAGPLVSTLVGWAPLEVCTKIQCFGRRGRPTVAYAAPHDGTACSRGLRATHLALRERLPGIWSDGREFRPHVTLWKTARSPEAPDLNSLKALDKLARRERDEGLARSDVAIRELALVDMATGEARLVPIAAATAAVERASVCLALKADVGNTLPPSSAQRWLDASGHRVSTLPLAPRRLKPALVVKPETTPREPMRPGKAGKAGGSWIFCYDELMRLDRLPLARDIVGTEPIEAAPAAVAGFRLAFNGHGASANLAPAVDGAEPSECRGVCFRFTKPDLVRLSRRGTLVAIAARELRGSREFSALTLVPSRVLAGSTAWRGVYDIATPLPKPPKPLVAPVVAAAAHHNLGDDYVRYLSEIQTVPRLADRGRDYFHDLESNPALAALKRAPGAGSDLVTDSQSRAANPRRPGSFSRRSLRVQHAW